MIRLHPVFITFRPGSALQQNDVPRSSAHPRLVLSCVIQRNKDSGMLTPTIRIVSRA